MCAKLCANTANNRKTVMANEIESRVCETVCSENNEDMAKKRGRKGIQQCIQASVNLSQNANIDAIRYNSPCFEDSGLPSFLLQTSSEEEHRQGSLKRRNYRKFSADEKWQIGMLASRIGTTRAIRQLQKQYSGLQLAESTVRSFKNLYMKAKQNQDKHDEPKVEKIVRGKYQTYTGKDRALIGKYAFENGSANAIRYFEDLYPSLSESTVRGFRNMYAKELERCTLQGSLNSETDANHVHEGATINLQTENLTLNNQQSSKDSTVVQPIEINCLPRRKRGRPGKIPSKIEALVVTYLGAVAEKDIKLLTYQAVIAITKGVIMVEDRLLLSEFGGYLIIDKGWAKSFLKRLHSCSLIPQADILKNIESSPFSSVAMEEDSDDVTASNNDMDGREVSVL